MGASFSTRLSKSNMELRTRIDTAATKVILDSNFTDLTKLSNEKYCNRLVNKVATVFQQNKDTVDLDLLREKLYDRRDDKTDEKNEKHNKKIKTPRIQNVEKKCIQISKFYVLFAHLFSCIISTINPSEIPQSNKKEKTTTTDSSKEKESSSPSLDFCSSRIDALVNGELLENSDGDLLVKPNVCKTNVSKSGSPLHLTDLPGMKALQQLYKDLNDGSSEMEDARYLYRAFVGKDAPDNIRNLHQIPLKVYSNDEECKEQRGLYYGGAEEGDKRDQRRDKERREMEKERMFYYYNERDRKKNEEENARTGVYLKGVVGSLKERLFSEYVQHIKEMIERAETNRSRLLEILSEMFTYTYNSDGTIDNVIINPSLTYKKLQSLVVQTRRIVIKLYTDCEEDYKNGLDIFFAMVQEKIALKLSVQEEVLKKQLEDVMYGPPERYIPESLLYQQYQGTEEFNKKEFIPPHFKSSVISIVKKSIPDIAFRQLLPELETWMNEEIDNANAVLDPKQVADEFIKENAYGDAYNDDNEYDGSRSAVAANASTIPFSPSSVVTTSISPPIVTPLKAKPSALKTATTSKSMGGPTISPSPRKIKPRASAMVPKQLAFVLEEHDE